MVYLMLSRITGKCSQISVSEEYGCEEAGEAGEFGFSAGTGEGSEQEMTRPDFVKDGSSGSTCGGNEVINTHIWNEPTLNTFVLLKNSES